MIKSTIRIVVELEHAHQRFQRNAKYITKIYCNGRLVTNYLEDFALELKRGFAMDKNYKCIIIRPFKGRFAYKNNEER